MAKKEDKIVPGTTTDLSEDGGVNVMDRYRNPLPEAQERSLSDINKLWYLRDENPYSIGEKYRSGKIVGVYVDSIEVEFVDKVDGNEIKSTYEIPSANYDTWERDIPNDRSAYDLIGVKEPTKENAEGYTKQALANLIDKNGKVLEMNEIVDYKGTQYVIIGFAPGKGISIKTVEAEEMDDIDVEDISLSMKQVKTDVVGTGELFDYKERDRNLGFNESLKGNTKQAVDEPISQDPNPEAEAGQIYEINDEDIDLHVKNTREDYNRLMDMFKNLAYKMRRGVYEHELAKKLFMYLVKDVAKKVYEGLNRWADAPGDKVLPVSKEAMDKACDSLATEFEQAYENNDYQFITDIKEKTKKPNPQDKTEEGIESSLLTQSKKLGEDDKTADSLPGWVKALAFNIKLYGCHYSRYDYGEYESDIFIITEYNKKDLPREFSDKYGVMLKLNGIGYIIGYELYTTQSDYDGAKAAAEKRVEEFIPAVTPKAIQSKKLSDEAQAWISKKIELLVEDEGKDQDQAAAIAYNMAREKGYDVPEKKTMQKKSTEENEWTAMISMPEEKVTDSAERIMELLEFNLAGTGLGSVEWEKRVDNLGEGIEVLENLRHSLKGAGISARNFFLEVYNIGSSGEQVDYDEEGKKIEYERGESLSVDEAIKIVAEEREQLNTVE